MAFEYKEEKPNYANLENLLHARRPANMVLREKGTLNTRNLAMLDLIYLF